MKNFLAFIFGFFLIFGLLGRSFASEPTCVFRSALPAPVALSTYTSNAGYVNIGFGVLDLTNSTAISPVYNSSSVYFYPYGLNSFWLTFWDGLTWKRKYFSSDWGRYTSDFLSAFEGLPYVVEPVNYATLYPNGVGCPGVCTPGSNPGYYTVPGKDFTFNYCLDSCALESSGVLYDSVNNLTFFHGSLSGSPCPPNGIASSPKTTPSPTVPQCPDGQIWSPSAGACVPISSGTGTAPISTDTTYPDSTPTYNPGDTGYGTPAIVAPPAAVTGPQTTTTGIRETTTTTINPDGSVTEETTKDETGEPLQAPDGQSESYNKPAKSINFQNFNNALNGFAQGGPVRFFSDMTQVFQSIVATPAAPIFRLPLPGHTMVVDLSVFDPVAQISRIMLSIFALVALGFFLLKQWRAG